MCPAVGGRDPLVQDLVPRAWQPGAAIDYRPLVNLLVPAPWNRGRVVMIGDTMAATTPHLASGAGIGIESAIVLAEELAANADLHTALDRFHARRWERCRLVVQNSERLCRIEIDGGDKQEHARIMRESMLALVQRGLGIALMPNSAVRRQSLPVVALTDPEIQWELVAACMGGGEALDPAPRAFLDLLSEQGFVRN